MSIIVQRDSLTLQQIKRLRNLFVVTLKPNIYQIKKHLDPDSQVVYIEKAAHFCIPYYAGINWCKKYNINYSTQEAPKAIKGNVSFKLRPNQLEVYPDILTHIQANHTYTLELATGFGKTVVAVQLAKDLGYKALVLFPSKLEEQWLNFIQQNTTMNAVIVSAKGKNYFKCDILLSTVSMLKYLNADTLAGIGTIFYEEAQMLCTRSKILELIELHAVYHIAITAKLSRRDGMEQVMKAIVGSKSIKVSADVNVCYISIHTGLTAPEERDDVGILFTKLDQDASSDPKYIRMITRVTRYMVKFGHKVLILCKELSNIKTIYDILIDKNVDAVQYHGSMKTHEDARVIITTVKKGGVGYDIANKAKNYNGIPITCVIMTNSFVFTPFVEQLAGRGYRYFKPTIIDMVHENDKFVQHHRERIKWVKESNCKDVYDFEYKEFMKEYTPIHVPAPNEIE